MDLELDPVTRRFTLSLCGPTSAARSVTEIRPKHLKVDQLPDGYVFLTAAASTNGAWYTRGITLPEGVLIAGSQRDFPRTANFL